MKILLLMFISLGGAHANAPTAQDIAKLLATSNEGFVGESGDMEMILISGGSKTIRKMNSKSREGENEDKTLLEFVLPKDVAGTKLLTWSYENKDDQQWIYLPALRRVKRITSSGKTSAFMGSEFTFEDLRKHSLDKYTYSNLKLTKGDWDWEYICKSKEKSGYSKQKVFASKKYLSPVKIEFYDRSGELLKVAKYSGFKDYKVKGRTFWRPGKISMENVQTQKKSIITWENRKIGTKIPNSSFKQKALK